MFLDASSRDLLSLVHLGRRNLGGITMGKFSKGEFSMEIEEFISVLKESDKHDWAKAVARISWNGNPTTLDIRSMNVAQNKAGKGISLSDEEADRLVDILLDNDYGSLESLTKAVDRKKSRFTVMSHATNCFDDNEPLRINIPV
jgi:hypothetical protein